MKTIYPVLYYGDEGDEVIYLFFCEKAAIDDAKDPDLSLWFAMIDDEHLDERLRDIAQDNAIEIEEKIEAELEKGKRI